MTASLDDHEHYSNDGPAHPYGKARPIVDHSPLVKTRGPVLETVTIPRPRCPRCRGTRLRRYRSLRDQGDGRALAWVECKAPACGHRFRLMQE